jgi:hypothetical protein
MTEISQIMADIFSTVVDYVHKISVTVTVSKPRISAGIVHIGRFNNSRLADEFLAPLCFCGKNIRIADLNDFCYTNLKYPERENLKDTNTILD